MASRKEASFFVETEKKKKNAWEKQEDIVTNVEKTHTKNAPNPLKINKNRHKFTQQNLQHILQHFVVKL